MKEHDKATARPWRVSTMNDYSGIVIETSERKPDDRQTVCTMEWDETHRSYCNSGAEAFACDIYDETKANAALIVQAVNEFDALKAVEKRSAELLEAVESFDASAPGSFAQWVEMRDSIFHAKEAFANLAAVRKAGGK